MDQKLTKEFAKKLMEIKGECRGSALKSDWEGILRKKGKEGLEKLERKMAELGFPLKFNEINPMDFYPIGFDALSSWVIREVFNFSEKELEELGAESAKFSLFLKFLIRYFFSLEKLAKEAPKIWRKHYTVGDLEVAEINEKEKYVILRLKNFALSPPNCVILRGYFSKILQMAVRSSISSQETKCVFRGDQYHEYLLKWR